MIFSGNHDNAASYASNPAIAHPPQWLCYGGRAGRVSRYFGIGSLIWRFRMGADVFIAFYGLEFPVPDGEVLTKIEEQNDERVVRAREHRLDWWLGRLTDGAPFHLLVGKKIGQFGVEGSHGAELSDTDVDSVREQTRQRLAAAGFQEAPRLILRYESDY